MLIVNTQSRARCGAVLHLKFYINTLQASTRSDPPTNNNQPSTSLSCSIASRPSIAPPTSLHLLQPNLTITPSHLFFINRSTSKKPTPRSVFQTRTIYPSPNTYYLVKSSSYIDTMNRIVKGRFHLASGSMAIGSTTSSYATNVIGRLKFIGRGPVTKASRGLKYMGRDPVANPFGRKEANACTRARGRRKARHIQLTTSSTAFKSANLRQ